MNLREVVPQVLEALRQSRVCLEDGPTVLVLSHKGKRVQVQVTQEGDWLKLSTGRVPSGRRWRTLPTPTA